MKIRKLFMIATAALALFSTSSFAELMSGWDVEGRVSQIYVGIKGDYSTSYPAVVFNVVPLNGAATQNFVFNLDNTDMGKSLLSQLYAAKTNGYVVQVYTGSTKTKILPCGMNRVSRIVVY